jgi:hypothetical protein
LLVDTVVGVDAMADDEVFEAVRARVEHDWPARVRDGRRLPAPASVLVVEDAEWEIGFAFPPLLRRIYLEIANGGIGPFVGIEGVAGGYTSGDLDMLGMVRLRRAAVGPDSPPRLPPGVVFLANFGCAMWALLDCRHPAGQMWWWESGRRGRLDLTFPGWLRAWLDGPAGDPRRTWARPAMRMPEPRHSPDFVDERWQLALDDSDRPSYR